MARIIIRDGSYKDTYLQELDSPVLTSTSMETSCRSSLELQSQSSTTTLDLSEQMDESNTGMASDEPATILNDAVSLQKSKPPQTPINLFHHDFTSRRSSGRARKPTAKAQALADSTSEYTVLTKSSDQPRRSPLSPKHDILNDVVPETNTVLAEPETPTASTPNESNIQQTVEEPVIRLLTRERKPTVKALEVVSTSRKRSRTPSSLSSPVSTLDKASGTKEEDKPRSKIVKLSYKGAKIPSGLRNAMSSTGPLPETSNAELKIDAITQNDQSSNVTEAKTKNQRQTRLILKAKKPSPDPTTVKKEKGTQDGPTLTVSNQKEDAVLPKPCDLSCLDPSSRLLAFAQIAIESSDSEDEDDSTTGLCENWLKIARERFCRCHERPKKTPSRATSADLVEALVPNTLYQASDKVINPPVSPSKTSEDRHSKTPIVQPKRISNPNSTSIRPREKAIQNRLVTSTPPSEARENVMNAFHTAPQSKPVITSFPRIRYSHTHLGIPTKQESRTEIDEDVFKLQNIRADTHDTVSIIRCAPSSDPDKARYSTHLTNRQMPLSHVSGRESIALPGTKIEPKIKQFFITTNDRKQSAKDPERRYPSASSPLSLNPTRLAIGEVSRPPTASPQTLHRQISLSNSNVRQASIESNKKDYVPTTAKRSYAESSLLMKPLQNGQLGVQTQRSGSELGVKSQPRVSGSSILPLSTKQRDTSFDSLRKYF